MKVMSKADRFFKSIIEFSSIDRKWIFGNDTDDPLRFAFDAKRTVHPIVVGNPLPKDKWYVIWNGFMNWQGEKIKRLAYIHIPFCQSRCLYCGFFQNFSDKAAEDIYIDHLIRELEMTAESKFIKSHPFHAVYFGGGTPSALTAENIKRLLAVIPRCLPLANDCELTFEARFHDFTDEKIHTCIAGGINRFSLGVQSFNSNVRRGLGRIDERDFMLDRLNYLMSIDNAVVVIDLMYGLPNQTMEIWRDDVMTLIECGIDGGDLYQLIVFEYSKLKSSIEKGIISPPAKISEQALMFKEGVEIMEQSRFKRLSMCHWGNGTRERNLYNSLSKSGADIIPFGAGAGGRIKGYRFFVERELKSYMERIEKGEKPLMMMVTPPNNYKLYDSIIGQIDRGYLNLRKIKTEHGVDLEEVLKIVFAEWGNKGLTKINGDYLDFTVAGQFWHINIAQAICDLLVKINDENYTFPFKAIAGQG